MNQRHTSSPSRRTVLRTAAWTAPAVTIAVAAPAFAASQESAPHASMKGKREAKDLYPVAVLNAGAGATLTSLSAVVTIDTGELDPRWGSVGAGWTRSAITTTSATYTYSGQLAAGQQLELAPFLRLTVNVEWSVIATTTFFWDGGSVSTSAQLGK